MKRNIFLTSIIIILLVFLSSCGLEPMGEGRSVNEYIFPYVDFELSKDKSYYEAYVLEGADVSSIYIPSYVEDNENPGLPVKVFKGFKNDEDMVNLKSITFESPVTEIEKGCLDSATSLSRITFNSVDNTDIWKNLPQLEHTEEGEFHGWLLVVNDGNVGEGGGMSQGYSSIYPNWGTHTFGETHAGQEPTCTEPGWTSYHECLNYLSKDEICPYTSKVDLPALGHSLVRHEKAAADCSSWSVGYSENCWECTRCGAFFSDSEGEVAIDENSVIIEPRHTKGGEIKYDVKDHWYVCSVCGKDFFGDGNSPEEHSFNAWEISEDGKYFISSCKVCGYEAEELIEHSYEDWDEVPAVNPTCTKPGQKLYYKCNKHSGHCFTLSKENIKIIRDKETLEKEIYIAPNGHSFGKEYVSRGEYHCHICSVCGAESDEKEEHEFEYIFTKNAERYITVKRKCIVCGATGESSSTNKSAFDVSASFGNIEVVRGNSNTWTLSYRGICSDCYWTDEKGEKLIDDADPFSISYTSRGGGEFKVFCYALNSKGEISEIAFALLTAN